jgi:acetyl-CoA acetyltransferase
VRRPVGIAGAGESRPVPEDPRSIPEMVLEAVQAAYADARCSHADIDAVVTASVDLLDGLTASNIAVTEVVDAVMKPETRVSSEGLAAALHAAAQIASGAYDAVLVVAHAKASMADFQALTRWALDPVHVQPLGADCLACSGLQAAMLADGDPGAELRWAEVAAKRRSVRVGTFPVPRTAEEILLSPVVAAPLREGMCAPLGDGACAVVLTAGRAPVRLAGMGWDLDVHALGERDLRRWVGLNRAFERACAAAGVEPRSGAFDLAEPSCLYPHEEELFRAATGIGERTELSPQGGLFAGTAPMAAGLSRLAAAARSVREGRAKRALAHGAWGAAGQGQAVALLEADR